MHENAIVYLLLVVFLIGMMLRAVELSVTFFFSQKQSWFLSGTEMNETTCILGIFVQYKQVI